MTTTNHFIRDLGLDRAAGLRVADVGGQTSAEPLRKRVNALHKSVVRAGRFRHVGAAAILMTLALVTAGVFGLYFTHHAVGGVAILLMAAALTALLLFSPQAVVRLVDGLEATVAGLRVQGTPVARGQPNDNAALVRQWMRQMLPLAGIKGIKDGLSAAASRAEAVDVDLAEHEDRAGKQLAAAEQQVHAFRLQLNQAASGWRGCFRARRVRRAARDVVNAIERRENAYCQVAAVRIARGEIAGIAKVLSDASVTAEDRVAVDAARIHANSLAQLEELRQQDGRNLAGKLLPRADSIVAATSSAVNREMGGILRRIADRVDSAPVETLIKEEVRLVLARTTVVPSSLKTCLSNGSAAHLAQIDAEAGEFAISAPTPGRVQRRVRWVMCQDAASSPLFQAIRQRSAGCTVRPVEHHDPDELICYTESRYEPGQELLELADAVPAIDAIDPNLRAAMITCVDDDDVILKDCSNQGSDLAQAARLLALAIVSGLVVRDRGHCYRLSDELRKVHGNGAVLAKGFDGATNAIHTDPRLQDILSVAVANHESARGAASVLAAIEAAMAQPDVPTAQRHRFKALLTDERDRLRILVQQAS